MLEPEDAETMANWDHGGGFSLDASVRVEGADRPGLERLLRSLAFRAGAPLRAQVTSRSLACQRVRPRRLPQRLRLSQSRRPLRKSRSRAPRLAVRSKDGAEETIPRRVARYAWALLLRGSGSMRFFRSSAHAAAVRCESSSDGGRADHQRPLAMLGSETRARLPSAAGPGQRPGGRAYLWAGALHRLRFAARGAAKASWN
ncbi:MAG: hypothetical protein CAPSK01_001960 [Candidatus Accumulibacter vicinus]|uniref:Uncharacterized protein n=1 Tax=Candidatus Accumulibacter vicinus TaxID=2954382 RepID=A0A084Y1H0_9PROT|nr:MAG: hypothetical protein CAPSK01_001960 [Candidatus Accumulibacter vicinus]